MRNTCNNAQALYKTKFIHEKFPWVGYLALHKKQQRYQGMRKKYNYLIFKHGNTANALYDIDNVRTKRVSNSFLCCLNETIDCYICIINAILNMLICWDFFPAIFASVAGSN